MKNEHLAQILEDAEKELVAEGLIKPDGRLTPKGVILGAKNFVLTSRWLNNCPHFKQMTAAEAKRRKLL